jgi:transcriptional regulator GlxA family with amidase domain
VSGNRPIADGATVAVLAAPVLIGAMLGFFHSCSSSVMTAHIAQLVARRLVMYLRRPGGQTQFAAPVWTERAELEPVRRAQELIDPDPGGDHRVGSLADRVGMSECHFARRFAEQTGASPAQYVTAVRIEAARRALESTGDTVEAIARRCGFGTAETMRRSFGRRLGVSPDHYRRRFRTGPTVRRRCRAPPSDPSPTEPDRPPEPETEIPT